MNFKLAD